MNFSKFFIWIERVWCLFMALSLIGLIAQFVVILTGHSFNFLTMSMCVWIVFILGILHFPISLYFLFEHRRTMKKAEKPEPAASSAKA